MTQEVHDGFEGVGLIAIALLSVALVALICPLLSVTLKLIKRTKIDKGGYTWASISAYGISYAIGYKFITLILTDKIFETAVLFWLGLVFCIASFIFAVIARGPGRLPAIVGSAFLTLVWLPFWYRSWVHHPS